MSFFEEVDFDRFFDSGIHNEPEIIPIITSDDDSTGTAEIPEILPVLPLRNTVLYPGVIIPITIGREKSSKLVHDAFKKDKTIGTVAQKDASIEDPMEKDLYKTGTLAHILKILEMPDGSTSVIIQGKNRILFQEYITDNPYFMAHVARVPEEIPNAGDDEFSAILSSLKEMSLKIIKISGNLPHELAFAIKNIDSPQFLINYIASNTNIKTEVKQEILEISDLKKRGIRVLENLSRELQMQELKTDIQVKVKADLDRQQREFLLNQQMKTIQDELGGNPAEREVNDLKQKAKSKLWGKEVADFFNREAEKLQRLNPVTGEFSVQLNFVQTLLDIPWNEYSKDLFDLNRAKKILDRDHFGLDKVKDRLIEHLAVLKLKGDMKSPILCLYGPPGVGKTSLGKSVAEALGRKYIRMSLGGLHDEAEIRGHRRTYIGAMPGRIMQNIKKGKTANPVFILDEIDKIGKDFHGDPASALLEVLDPEQNNAFHDNYIEMEFDLSKVLFIATANQVSTIHPALRDRMEMIEINGYILEEKMEIARRHLIPKQLENHGLKKNKIIFTKEVIRFIVEKYTRESGVRTLDKRIASVVRRVAKKVAMNEKFNTTLSTEDIIEFLGAPRFTQDLYEGNDIAGVVTGLAWTEAGGDILFVETSLSQGNGKLTMTGNLGDVMKESALLAHEYIKAHPGLFNLPADIFNQWNVHVHVPEGAIPKDGPSAGITMMTSMASAFTQRKVRKNIAMTGEITLRGKILPVGGIKEKILAAKRAGITDIALSGQNKKDIEEIKELYREGLSFHYVETVPELLQFALLEEIVEKPIDIKKTATTGKNT